MSAISIISISGVSGVGKTVLLQWLLEIIQPSGLVPSYTTRGRRPSDIGEYNYINPEQFRLLKESNEFAWFVDEYGNQYGTKADDLHQAVLDAGSIKKVSMLLIVPKTIHNLRHQMISFGGEVISFYVYCSDENELRRRLMERDRDPGAVERRMVGSRYFSEEASRIKGLHWIDNSGNDNLAKAKEEILKVLREEGSTGLPKST